MATVVAPPPTPGPVKRRLVRRGMPGERWWFGLLLVPALISVFVVWHRGSAIESDLETHATQALRAAGLPGSTVEASGLAITLKVPTGEDADQARAVVAAVDGVMSVKVVDVPKDAAEAAACAELTKALGPTGLALPFPGATVAPTPAEAQLLAPVTDLLLRCPSISVVAAGYTDDSVPGASQVATARAQAVAAQLTAAGVPAERVSAQGFGDSSRLAQGGDANNRVVLAVK